MEQKELKIDVAAVGRETLQERQPREDLDETLLRTCKKLYGESGIVAFQAVQSTLTALAERTKVDHQMALKQIAEGQSSVRVTTRIQTSKDVSATSVEELSPELRAEVEKALAEGKSTTIFTTKTMNKRRQQIAMNRCESCGCEFSSELSTCPQCGRMINRSFWSRLFGK